MKFVYDNKNVLRIVREMSDQALAEVALRVSEIDPEVFARAVLGADLYETSINGIDVALSHEDLCKLQEHARLDQKVTAIKWLREKFNLGLKEAKDLTEQLAGENVICAPRWVYVPPRPSVRADFDDDIPF